MEAVELEGCTLGQKHQRYNKLFQDAIKQQRTVNAEDFNLENNDNDIDNLLNIDIASHSKDTKYILKVLCCEDMLYVSKAIKRANWLINDESYAHIINPNFLSTNVFPYMQSKAKYKLIKHIRHNLKNEKRAEEFYSHEENPKEACKWLPTCSVEFIEKNVINHIEHIKTTLLRRLCEKSITVLDIYIKNDDAREKNKALQANMFLLPSNTDKYLDIVETVSIYDFPNFNKRATKILMNNSPNRIIDKFETYINSIHLPTFIMCLKQENVKDFLLRQAQKMEGNLYRSFNFKRLNIFVALMPKDIRFEFVKQVFIDKKHESTEKSLFSEKEILGMSKLCDIFHTSPYFWYQYAPFDVAFQKLKEFIGTTTDVHDKRSMLEVLLTSAKGNLTNERSFLEYFKSIHNNKERHIEEDILKKLLVQNNFLKYDSGTWAVLEDILNCLDVYSESGNQQYFIEIIILYKVLHEENIQEVVKEKFNFNSLVSYHKNLDETQKTLILKYLYGIIISKLAKCDTQSETGLAEKIYVLEKALILLKDYQQELDRYPALISTSKELIKIINNSSWTVSMEKIFNIKKSWRKLFFEESLILCPNESSLLNALKHGPYILERNKNLFQNMLCNDKRPLRHFLGKIKIYWSNSLADNITVTYMEKLNTLGDHQASTLGLSILLPRKILIDLLEKYAPHEAKIDWSKIDEVKLSVQQQFAKKMHNARPQPHPDIILWYAKGDYLQYALPSLLSIFYNLNSIASQQYIPTILSAPVSLQKHGIRFAVSKMEIEQLLCQFFNIWKNNTNASIRCVMFKNIYDLLCKEKDSKKIQTAWELIKMFIENLTSQEDKSIYKLLFEIQKVPYDVRGCFYMDAYNFLHKMITSEKEFEEYKHSFNTTFTTYAIEIMEQLSPDFVAGIIMEFIENIFTKTKVAWAYYDNIKLVSSYLLAANNTEIQLERYKKILEPLFKKYHTSWNIANDEECFVRNNLTKLLDNLRCDVKKYVVDTDKVLPRTMFSLIQKELEDSLPITENYMLITKWKLTATFVEILYKHQPILNWEEACIKAANEFGNVCYEYLIKDCNNYYPSIYLLFVKALKSMLRDFVSQTAHLDIYKCFIQRENFIEGYLATIKFLPSGYAYYNDGDGKKSKEILTKVKKHPSNEIKIHYYKKFQVDDEYK